MATYDLPGRASKNPDVGEHKDATPIFPINGRMLFDSGMDDCDVAEWTNQYILPLKMIAGK